MYPVSLEYQNKIKENNRTFKVIVQIQHSTGVLELTDKDIVGGSIVYTEGSQSGEDFTIGGTVASTFDIKLANKLDYANIDFEGATIIPQIGLLLREHVDVNDYFLSAPQPSEFVDGEGQEIWEYVPLGRFNIDECKKLRNTIEIKAIDNMINLDIPYNLSKLSYPATLYQIYTNICNIADVSVGTTTFPNKDYIVQERPTGDYTLRDILGYVAELSGCFARFNRLGALELTWYKSSGLSLDPSNRFNFFPREDVIKITGVQLETEEEIYRAGTEGYIVDLTGNPLLQNNYGIVLNSVYNNVKDITFTPFESNWQGNPALQTGDIVTQTDRDGNIYTTVVTHSTYKYRGASSFNGKGLPLKAKGYKGSTNKKITNIVRQEVKPIGNKLTTLEQAQLNATELIANMLGGYAHYEADAFYVTDNPVLANAMKVWKWGIGGFGYSSTGIAGPYTTAVTADGSIVADLVSAGIVTADMIQAGILQSNDGSTWLNLNNGEFSLSKGNIWIDKDKVRVYHTSDKSQYTDLRYNGVFRKWLYGEGNYLNDIHIAEYTRTGMTTTSMDDIIAYESMRLTLPQSFRGRLKSSIKIFLIPTSLQFWGSSFTSGGNVTYYNAYSVTESQVVDYRLDVSSPYVDVKAIQYASIRRPGRQSEYDVSDMKFLLVVIGY